MGLENNPNLYTKTYDFNLKDSNFKPGGKQFYSRMMTFLC